MHQYPIFLNLEEKQCLVVGAGKVGLRKIAMLLDAKPDSIHVLDTAAPSSELAELLKHSVISFEQRAYRQQDLDDVFLVYSATTSPAVNARIASDCAARNILCNIADAPQLSSFIVPACVRRGDLSLAISTGGHSPALSKRIRRELETVFGKEYELFTGILGRLRPLILKRGTPTQENTTLFRKLVESGLLSALATEDLDRAASHLREILPEDLHSSIEEVLHGSN